ncbi:MAG TPA: YfhO family protein [Thermoanaerobaculia bacterium]|nr:YfhO family protein [Thermoanaerobaculia bacterium]
MPLLVYTLTALLILALVHRFLVPLSRGAAAFLFLLPFLFVGHALIANRVYAPIDKIYMDVPLSVVKERYGIGDPHNPATADIFSQMIPWRHAVRESVLRGEWPLWNPYILSGDILAAAAQPAVYSPFTWLALLMPAPLSFTFTAAITFLIAATGAFVLARDLGCREVAASVAAAGFMCACGTTLYILWPLGLSWALFPLVLLGARRAVHAPSVRSWALLTTAFVLLIMAGHPESVLHIVVLGACYGAFEWLQHRKVRAIGVALAAGAVALLVCAIFLLPYFEALPQTAEYSFRQLWKGSDRSAKTTQVLLTLATDVFPDLHLRKWTKPDIGGTAGETAAVGSIILALALYAAWRVRSRTTWFFTIATLIVLAAHAGWKPVARAIHALPGFDITLNDRLAFGVSCMLAILAAIGVEHLQRRSAAVTLAAVLAFLAFGAWWIARTYVIEPGPRDWGEQTTLAELLFLGIAACALVVPVPSPHRSGERARVRGHGPLRGAAPHPDPLPARGERGLLLLVLLIAQRGISEYNVHASFPKEAAYPEMKLFEPLKSVREPFRIAGTHWALLPATNALYGLEDVRGYEAMTFHPYVKTWELWSTHQPVFFNRTDDLSKPFLSMMNVRFAFSREDAPVPPGWREVAREGAATLLENERVLPRAFVPRNVTVGMQSEVAVDQMADVTDFSERAWITADVVPYERTNGPGRVVQRGDTLEADMQGDGWIVVTNSAWQGWRAYLDGKRIKLQRANVAFLGIHVPKGKHTIRLVYLPESFVTGRAVSGASLVGIAAFMLWRRRRSSPRRPYSRSSAAA